MSPEWVSEYRSLSEAQDTPVRSSSRKLCRDPSSDNLFVDLDAQPGCPQSDLFLENMLYHESKLETIDEAVGMAHDAEWTGRGSMFASVFTLVASAMGAGCLSLPHMFSRTGLVPGLVLLACGAVLAHVSLVILMSCARYTQSRSFAELVSFSEMDAEELVRPQRHFWVDVVITLYGMAAVLIYMMLIGDFFTDIAKSPVFGHEVPRQSLILGSLLVVFPMSIPRNVTALRYISFFSTSSIVFLTVVVVAKTPGLWRAAAAAEEERKVK
ncbi:unnamed protein product, partial [Effrenium voratum]